MDVRIKSEEGQGVQVSPPTRRSLSLWAELQGVREVARDELGEVARHNEVDMATRGGVPATCDVVDVPEREPFQVRCRRLVGVVGSCCCETLLWAQHQRRRRCGSDEAGPHCKWNRQRRAAAGAAQLQLYT